MAKSLAENPNAAALDVTEHGPAAARLLAARLLPFIPPLVLLTVIYLFAVNVPFGEEWDLIPFLERLLDGTLGWEGFLTAPVLAAKLVAAPLALATDFDVTADMYAGFGLQLLAFIVLWSVLELTLRVWRRRLITGLSVILALLMFSMTDHEVWLSGWTSLRLGMGDFAAAVIVWLQARWPTRGWAFVLCFFFSCVGMLGLPSGVMLWGLVLLALGTRSLAERKVQWRRVGAWVIGSVLLAGAYLSGFATTVERTNFSFVSAHPLQACIFVLAYLGWPLVQIANLWVAGGAGAVGLVLLVLAGAASRHDPSDVRSVLPWLWLSGYAVMAALLAATSQLEEGAVSASAGSYTAGSFFWIGLAAVVSVVLPKSLPQPPSWNRWLRWAAIVAVIAWGVNYARLCYDGYLGFVQRQRERTAALKEIYRKDTAFNEALVSLYPDATRAWEYVQVLEQRRLGPFSRRMSGERRRLENDSVVATEIVSGEGVLDVAACTVIAGWAWDSRQPEVSVNVGIYDGTVLIRTELASRFRRDLLNNDKGDGSHSFSFATPQALKDGRTHTIHARIAGTDVDLYYSPKELGCP